MSQLKESSVVLGTQTGDVHEAGEGYKAISRDVGFQSGRWCTNRAAPCYSSENRPFKIKGPKEPWGNDKRIYWPLCYLISVFMSLPIRTTLKNSVHRKILRIKSLLFRNCISVCLRFAKDPPEWPSRQLEQYCVGSWDWQSRTFER